MSSPKRVLFLSFYFEPDLCAGSFRSTALIKAMQDTLPSDTQIDVVTTLPNRYSSFSVDVAEHQERGEISIHRIKLPSHQSGMADQSKAFLTYARAALALIKGKKYDLVYATSSRLMTASLGAYIARKLKVPLYLDIRDIFVDTIGDVLPKKMAVICKPIFSLLERWTMRRAQKINLVSQGFETYFRSRYPEVKLSFFTNGIDDEFLAVAPTVTKLKQSLGPTKILYAGNIGEGQGLHRIVPPLAAALGRDMEITVIGDGGRKSMLESAIAELDVANVRLLPPVSRAQLLDAYEEADILFLHLNDYPAFEKVLPSKVFEYGALGKPILAGVAGYSASFIEQEVENAAVFAPCDVDAAMRALASLKMETAPRTVFNAKFARTNVMREMADDIASVLSTT